MSELTSSTVALVLSKPTGAHNADPFYSQRVQVVLCVLNSKVLTYYSYWDHPRQEFLHTDALLLRLAPVSVIHVAAFMPKNNTVVPKLLGWLESRQKEYSLSTADDEVAVENIIQHHSSWSASANALERLPTVLKEMLPEEQCLQVAGDTEVSGNSAVSKGLVFFLQAHGWWDETNVELKALQVGVLESHLYLDRTAAQAIHLWPPVGEGAAVHTGGLSHNNSIASLLSQPCLTPMSKRLLEMWLRQPLVDLKALTARQDAIEYWVHHSVALESVRSEGLRLLKGQDLGKLAAALAEYGQGNENDTSFRTKDALKTLYELYMISAQKLPLLLEQLFNECPDTLPPLLQDKVVTPLQEAVAALSKSVELATAVLDLDAAPRDFLVQSSYQPELGDIARELKNVQDELQACHDDMNEEWAGITGNTGAVRLESDNESWQFRLTNTNDSKILQQRLPQVQVHRLLKNGVYFSTKRLRELAVQQQDLLAEYNRHQTQIAADALQVAATYQQVLQQASDAIALLDVLCALANVAAYSPHGYCRPQLTDVEEGGGIELKSARHPCVELQENVEFIPNDVNLVLDKSNFLIVTGPNSKYLLIFPNLDETCLTHVLMLLFSGWKVNLHSSAWRHRDHGTDWLFYSMCIGQDQYLPSHIGSSWSWRLARTRDIYVYGRNARSLIHPAYCLQTKPYHY